MEYSGPEPLVNIEADLALSEDDDLSQEHWPKLNPPRHRKLAPTAAVPQPMDHATISTKRRMEPDSDSSSESPSPVAKSSKSNKTPLEINTPVHHLPRPANQRISTMPAPATPAFAPRIDYVKLIFRDNPGVEPTPMMSHWSCHLYGCPPTLGWLGTTWQMVLPRRPACWMWVTWLLSPPSDANETPSTQLGLP
ncbi:hypothetical protein Pcinc_020339 [Petrolisthes cinctipes]|uniref:Uncharacterized protein n=1 Tax=Petrolisthes cinctipes TaxID=88211 RepID=A0AAE1FKE9_PETCI|nr:hypothetical protein Pcinc_020339 [Petrolisthes cinctipes]